MCSAPLCPRNTWLWEWKSREFPQGKSEKGGKGLQWEGRCCWGGDVAEERWHLRREPVAGLQNTVELEIWGTERIIGQEVGRWSEILEEVPKLPYLVHLGESSLLSSHICFGKGPGEVSAESESQSQLEKIKTQTKPDSLFWGHFHMH